jgi:hypothetical protein
MVMLPNQTYLGQLRILEVYEAADEPCLFSCRNGAGHIFLVVLLDETDELKDWLYVPLSPDRFAEVRSGEVDLRDAFRGAEDGFVHRVMVPIYGGVPIVGSVNCDALTDEMLPLAGECLRLDLSQVA